jgi:hypothetical protein
MHGAAGVFQIVEYSRDKWNMERVPRALLACMVGLFFVVYVDPQPAGSGILRAFIALVVVSVVGLLAHFLLEQLFEGTPIVKVAAGAIIVIALVALFWNSPGDLFRSRRTSGIPGAVIGWIFVMGGLGWIAFALYRHFNPARPILTLSPEGISYHVSWLKNFVIPWHEVQAVAALERGGGPGVIPNRFDDVTVTLVSTEFYERNILPRRTFLAGPGWDDMFIPRGPSMQMVLHFGLFSISPKDIREPIDLRWKAFRAEPPRDAGRALADRRVYGAWSLDGSLWQATKFLVPLIGIVWILIDSTAVLHR